MGPVDRLPAADVKPLMIATAFELRWVASSRPSSASDLSQSASWRSRRSCTVIRAPMEHPGLVRHFR